MQCNKPYILEILSEDIHLISRNGGSSTTIYKAIAALHILSSLWWSTLSMISKVCIRILMVSKYFKLGRIGELKLHSSYFFPSRSVDDVFLPVMLIVSSWSTNNLKWIHKLVKLFSCAMLFTMSWTWEHLVQIELAIYLSSCIHTYLYTSAFACETCTLSTTIVASSPINHELTEVAGRC
jgi:hypothetical protein